MASVGSIEKSQKIDKLIAKYKNIRAELKLKISDQKLTIQDRVKAMIELDKICKNSSRVRHRNRCAKDGSPRSYMRSFGLSRHAFREIAAQGLIPGVKKTSW